MNEVVVVPQRSMLVGGIRIGLILSILSMIMEDNADRASDTLDSDGRTSLHTFVSNCLNLLEKSYHSILSKV
jgi:c-di-AMP phosphodiesterase-like protein